MEKQSERAAQSEKLSIGDVMANRGVIYGGRSEDYFYGVGARKEGGSGRSGGRKQAGVQSGSQQEMILPTEGHMSLLITRVLHRKLSVSAGTAKVAFSSKICRDFGCIGAKFNQRVIN